MQEAIQAVNDVVTLNQGKALILMITASVTFGLVILAVIMQAVNYVRIARYERKLQEEINVNRHYLLRIAHKLGVDTARRG